MLLPVCQPVSFGWTEWNTHWTLDSYLKNKLKTNTDMNVTQFHSISYLDLQYLRETMEGKADLDPDVRGKTDRMGDCCLFRL